MLVALYIDVTTGNLLTNLNNASTLSKPPVQLFAGDSGLILQVYLLQPLASPNPSQFPFEIIGTNGLALEAFLDNGELPTAPGYELYTQCVNFQTDPNNQYFYGAFPLNTAAIAALMGNGTSATATLHVGFLSGGNTQTVLYESVTLQPGIANQVGAVPAGLTPLSQQGGDQRYCLLTMPAGEGRIMTSPGGIQMQERCVDNGDGTASVAWIQI